MNTHIDTQNGTAELRDAWKQTVQMLDAEVADWAQEEGWQARTSERILNKESIGAYEVLDMVIETPKGQRKHPNESSYSLGQHCSGYFCCTSPAMATR